MERKTIVKYSIVRYIPNYIANEVINVGVIFHLIDHQTPSLKFYLLEENSAKIKSLVYNKVGIREYKSYREYLTYYLNQVTENMLGYVGEISYGSIFDESFLESVKEQVKTETFYLTGVETALTHNVDQLFKTIYNTYIGIQYYPDATEKMAIKQYVHNVFESKNFINKKVLYNYDYYPIKDLVNLKFRVDFKFNDSIDNYLMSTPNTTNSTTLNEWFAKTKLMFDSIENDSEFYLLYNNEILNHSDTAMRYLRYLTTERNNVKQLNVDEGAVLEDLCTKIDTTAQDVILSA